MNKGILYYDALSKKHQIKFIWKTLSDTHSNICNVFHLNTQKKSVWFQNCDEMYHEINLLWYVGMSGSNCHKSWKTPCRDRGNMIRF